MTMTMTRDGNIDARSKLLSHYDKVKARIGNPHNMPVKNRIKEVLAAVAARKAAEFEEKERERVEKAVRRRFADSARRRRAKVRKMVEEAAPTILDFSDPMKGCSVKNRAVRQAVKLILERYRVTWALVASPVRVQHVVEARAVVVTLLYDLGCSAYEIGRELGKDNTTIYALLRRYAERVRDNPCFLDAINCVKHNGQVS